MRKQPKAINSREFEAHTVVALWAPARRRDGPAKVINPTALPNRIVTLMASPGPCFPQKCNQVVVQDVCESYSSKEHPSIHGNRKTLRLGILFLGIAIVPGDRKLPMREMTWRCSEDCATKWYEMTTDRRNCKCSFYLELENYSDFVKQSQSIKRYFFLQCPWDFWGL